MKKLRIISKSYTARNILNNEVIENYINVLLGAEIYNWNNNVRVWIKNKLRKYFYNDFPLQRITPIMIENVLYTLEGRFVNLDRMEYEVYEYVKVRKDKLKLLNKVKDKGISWIEIIDDNILEVLEYLNTLPKEKFNFDYVEAVKRMKAEKPSLYNDPSKIMEVFKSSGYTWYKILDYRICRAEGEVLQNCLRNYTQSDIDEVDIYVMKKDKNALVAVEIEHGYIKQVKGKQNKIPDKKYWKGLREFIAFMKVGIIKEGDWDEILEDLKLVLEEPSEFYILLEECEGKKIRIDYEMDQKIWNYVQQAEHMYSGFGSSYRIIHLKDLKIDRVPKTYSMIKFSSCKINYLNISYIIEAENCRIEKLHGRTNEKIEIYDCDIGEIKNLKGLDVKIHNTSIEEITGKVETRTISFDGSRIGKINKGKIKSGGKDITELIRKGFVK